MCVFFINLFLIIFFIVLCTQFGPEEMLKSSTSRRVSSSILDVVGTLERSLEEFTGILKFFFFFL